MIFLLFSSLCLDQFYLLNHKIKEMKNEKNFYMNMLEPSWKFWTIQGIF